jgi:predicted cobalt transporter CbtA
MMVQVTRTFWAVVALLVTAMGLALVLPEQEVPQCLASVCLVEPAKRPITEAIG